MTRRTRPTARRLSHPPSTLLTGLIGLAAFAGLAIISNVYPDGTTTRWTTALFAGLALASVPLITAYFLAQHEVSEDGLAYRTVFGARRYLRWADLRGVTYAPAMKWFRLEGRTGAVARLSVMLRGLPEFATLLLEHAPRHALAPETLRILRETAAGRPPPIGFDVGA